MNLQSMLLIGMLMGNSVATDIEYYEYVYAENYEQKQEEKYLEQIMRNPQDITLLNELANYYENLWKERSYNFYEEDDYNIENFYKAEEVYKEIIKINPKSTALAEFYFRAADIVFGYNLYENDNVLELYKKSFEEYLRILEIDNDNIEVMTALADVDSKLYYYIFYYNGLDDPNYVSFFDEAEKLYLDILNIDKDNIEIRYKLIDLYEDEWDIYNAGSFEKPETYKYFEKIEKQFLEIVNIDSEERYYLIEFYKDCFAYKDIECTDKIEEQYLKLLETKVKEYDRIYILIDMGEMYEINHLYYPDNDFLGKAEYCYKSALDIDSNNTYARDRLIEFYERCYYFLNFKSEDDFKTLEKAYKEYSALVGLNSYENLSFELGQLYADRWLIDKSDYTYYYLAENEYYKGIDYALELDDSYNSISMSSIYEYLIELYGARYEFDHDKEVLNIEKHRLMEKISSIYASEISYIDNETRNPYVNTDTLEKLGDVYYGIWKLDKDDMQYCEKAEQVYLKLLDIEKEYRLLQKLGELYTERWLLDKSEIEYKLKAIECLNTILADEDEESYILWEKEDIYSLLEKLEL